jgi:two-component system response regulator YesN
VLKTIIIDDEKYILKGMEKIIDWEALGYTITGTYNKASYAIEKALQDPPDLIITDIVMPGMSGLELISSLKNKLPKTKFVVLSAYDFFEYAREALKYGAFRYLLKPINKDELIELLNEIKSQKKEDTSTINGYYLDKVTTESHIVSEVKSYISRNYKKSDLKLNAIAEKYFINYSYLSYIFKKDTGINFNEYLLNIRMEEAKKLLLKSNLPIREIAKRVGYSGKNFYPAFKKHFGITPNSFRSKHVDQINTNT